MDGGNKQMADTSSKSLSSEDLLEMSLEYLEQGYGDIYKQLLIEQIRQHLDNRG